MDSITIHRAAVSEIRKVVVVVVYMSQENVILLFIELLTMLGVMVRVIGLPF